MGKGRRKKKIGKGRRIKEGSPPLFRLKKIEENLLLELLSCKVINLQGHFILLYVSTFVGMFQPLHCQCLQGVQLQSFANACRGSSFSPLPMPAGGLASVPMTSLLADHTALGVFQVLQLELFQFQWLEKRVLSLWVKNLSFKGNAGCWPTYETTR